MKNIKKLKSYGKAVAGSALLVGATLTGAAGLAAAQSGSSGQATLADYPHPFVDDEGNLDSTVVVGTDGKQADVVSAIDIAGNLGNNAFSSETVEGTAGAVDGEQTETTIRQGLDISIDASDYSGFVRETVEDDDGNDVFVTESASFDEDATSAVNGTEAEVEFNSGDVTYNVKYSPGFQVNDTITLLGEEYELTSVESGEVDLGSSQSHDVEVGDSFEHGPYTVEVTGKTSGDDSQPVVRVSEGEESLDTQALGDGEELTVGDDDEFTVTAETVIFYDDGTTDITLESTYTDTTLESGEDFPSDDRYQVPSDGLNVNTDTDGPNTLQGITLANQVHTVEDPEDEDETAPLEAGESFAGPNNYFSVTSQGLTNEATETIEFSEDYEVTYTDKNHFEHSLDLTQLTSATGSGVLTTSNEWSSTSPPVGFYNTGGNSWEQGSDVIVEDSDEDGFYTGSSDVLVDAGSGGQSSISPGDSLTGFESNDDVYYEDADGSSDNPSNIVPSSDSLFVDSADDGFYNKNGQLVSSTTLTSSISTVDPEFDITLQGTTTSTVKFDSAASSDLSVGTNVESETNVGLQSSTSVTQGSLVEIGSTGKYYIATDHVNSDGRSSDLSLISDGSYALSSADTIAGKNLVKQTIGSGTSTGDTIASGSATSTGTDSTATLTFTDGGTSSTTYTAGDVLSIAGTLAIVTSDTTISSGGSGDVNVVMAESSSVSSSDSVSIVTSALSDGSTVGTVDNYFLNSQQDIVDSLNNAFSEQSIGATADYNYAGNSKLRLQSTDTSSSSSVTVSSTTGNGADVTLGLAAGTSSGPDSIIINNAGLGDGESSTEVITSNGAPIGYDDTDSNDGTDNGNYDLGEDIYKEEKSGALTYSAGEDNKLSGTKPSGNPSLSFSNPWSGVSAPVTFIDAAEGSSWNQNADLIAVDEDNNGVYSSSTDTKLAGTEPTGSTGLFEEGSGDKTVYTDVSGYPVQIEYDDSSDEVTMSYQEFEETITTGESKTFETGYGFTLDVSFTDTDNDGTKELTVSGSDSELNSEFGAKIRKVGTTVEVVEEDSNVLTVDYSSGNINQITGSAIPTLKSDDNDDSDSTLTNYGSAVELSSDSSASMVYPDERRQQLTAFGSVGEGSSDGEVMSPTGWPADSAKLDSEVSRDQNMILVGGPLVNSLTADLADQGSTWNSTQYESNQGVGVLDLVNDAFDGNNALVVAGWQADDTSAAAEYLVDNAGAEELEGRTTVQVDTESGELVQ